MKFKKLSIITATSLIASSSLMAAQMPKFYAGVGYGFGKTSFGSPATGNQSSTIKATDDGNDANNLNIDNSASFTAAKTSAYRLFVGAKWQIKQTPWQFGVEYGYNNPYDTKYNTTQTLSDVEVLKDGASVNNIWGKQQTLIEQTLKSESMDFLAKAFYQVPNSKVSINAGLGFAYSTLKNTVTSSPQELQKGELDDLLRDFSKALQSGIGYDVSHTAMQPEVSLGGDYYFNRHIFAGVNWRQVFGSDPTYYDTSHANMKDAFNNKIVPIIGSESIPDSFLNSIKQDAKSAVEASDNKKLPSNYSVTIDVGYQF